MRADLRIGSADNPGIETAATLVAPADASGCDTVICAFPGGGYNRHYFDLRHPSLGGATQAEWHARRGVIFIAFDPYGGGDSTALDASQCTLALTVRAVHEACLAAIEGLRAGTLVQDLEPIAPSRVIGIGHSLGGMQLIAQQGQCATFDAVAMLGFSAIHCVTPTPSGFVSPHSSSDSDAESLEEAWSGPLVDEIANLRFAYHWENVAPDLVNEDMSAGFPVRRASPLPFWITRTFPPFAKICMQEGIIAEDAGHIDVPVLVALGQRDVARDLRQEALAFPKSVDITLFEVLQCAHMHNFSPAREVLWRRLQSWVDGLSKTR
ncbi:MAG: alpha/beta hydrolase [Rhizobiaceae bacterium]